MKLQLQYLQQVSAGQAFFSYIRFAGRFDLAISHSAPGHGCFKASAAVMRELA